MPIYQKALASASENKFEEALGHLQDTQAELEK